MSQESRVRSWNCCGILLLMPSNYRLRGQALLPLVLLIGGLIVLMSLTVIFLARSFLASSYGFQISERAKAVAASGANDALLRLARDRKLEGTYSLAVGSYSATVTITKCSETTEQATISSVATVSNYQRTVTAVVSCPSDTGQISLISWQYTQ